MKRVERMKDAHGYAYPHLAHSNMQNEITFMLLFTNEIVNWTSCCGLFVKKEEEELKKRKHKNRYNTSFKKREREGRRIVLVLRGVGDDQRSHLRLSRSWRDGVSSSVS